MRKKILFFGHNSFASQDLKKSINKKFKVSFFSRKRDTLLKSKKFDLKRKRPLNLKLKEQYDYLFFFSSFVPLNENEYNWKKCRDVNIFGLVNFLSQSNVKVKKIVHASSCSLYGLNKKKIDEDVFLNPSSSYSLSKFEQENILRIYCNEKKIKYLSYRLGYVFGANMNKNRILSKLLISTRNNKKIKLFNMKKNLNLIHTKQIDYLIIRTFQKEIGVINLVTDKEINLAHFKLLLKDSEKNIRFKKNPVSSKIYKKYKTLKRFNFNSLIKNFKNEN